MTDADREAFEKYAQAHEHRLLPLPKRSDEPWAGCYEDANTQNAEQDFLAGMKTVRESDAPKLTEREAVEIVRNEIAPVWDADWSAEGYARAAMAVLRSAGVQFKEEP